MSDAPAQDLIQDQTQNRKTDQDKEPQVPSSPERPIMAQKEEIQTLAPDVETQTPQEAEPTPELLKPEVQPKPTPAPEKKSNDPDDTTQQSQDQEEKPKNVIDLRTGDEELKRVNPDADKLTTIADIEEQEFIEEVEKHHGSE